MLQARQVAALAALPEDQRDFMAFMFRTGDVSAYTTICTALSPVRKTLLIGLRAWILQ
ncbi:hypothetical protein [Dyadobacter sp. CY347]|uniref:hypothetical protein n=1 Tax=Dyadobacter sp. CY347 TaxID=2909336 RepID=UPI001F1C3648|nr:hypothetical protein [Dyadobacter sp. CY347]MCF2491499.1 hypothetical protein [Dyadobacter sp. CY347]